MAIMIFLHVLMTKKVSENQKISTIHCCSLPALHIPSKTSPYLKKRASTNRNIQSLLQFIFIHSSHGNAQVIKDAICNTCSIPQVLCCALQNKEKEI